MERVGAFTSGWKKRIHFGMGNREKYSGIIQNIEFRLEAKKNFVGNRSRVYVVFFKWMKNTEKKETLVDNNKVD